MILIKKKISILVVSLIILSMPVLVYANGAPSVVSPEPYGIIVPYHESNINILGENLYFKNHFLYNDKKVDFYDGYKYFITERTYTSQKVIIPLVIAAVAVIALIIAGMKSSKKHKQIYFRD